MKITNAILFVSALVLIVGCIKKKNNELTSEEKQEIQTAIQEELDQLLHSVRTKNIDAYMERMPEDFIIYDESGEIITREMQRAYALRDWSIIDTTLNDFMSIDSIHYLSRDSIHVFTFQRWERLMFQRDGITLDTVLTTQSHRELWKRKSQGWTGYDVLELGGEIFINGEAYSPE